MKIYEIDKDALYIYRIIMTNTENGRTSISDYNEANEAVNAAIRMLEATPNTITAEIDIIAKAPYRRAQKIGKTLIFRNVQEL